MACLRFAFTILVLGLVFSPAHGQGWNGIIPLHSTRSDVEKILGKSNEELSAYSSLYRTTEGTVIIDYADGLPCSRRESEIRWRVPRNTVENVLITPNRESPLSKLRIDVTKYRTKSGGDRPEDIYYINDESGETLRVFQGQVMSITYAAAAKDAVLKCVAPPKRSPTGRSVTQRKVRLCRARLKARANN